MLRRTPLKRGTKSLKRTGFRQNGTNTAVRTKKRPKAKKPGKKRKSISHLKKKLWEECKRIIRLRYVKHDGTWNCFTCDARLEQPSQAQTGHFIPSSVCSTEMRYDLDNLRVQCYRCNINLSGNWIEYEKRLNQEMGQGFTEKLKQRNESTKGLMYRSDWYEMYINNYRQIL